MSIQSFIAEKAMQLEHYIEGYWRDDISYSELQRFIWDTLEEWARLENRNIEAYSHQERVFWHVFFMVQKIDESTLNDQSQNDELSFLMQYLNNNRLCPIDVIGMRP